MSSQSEGLYFRMLDGIFHTEVVTTPTCIFAWSDRSTDSFSDLRANQVARKGLRVGILQSPGVFPPGRPATDVLHYSLHEAYQRRTAITTTGLRACF